MKDNRGGVFLITNKLIIFVLLLVVFSLVYYGFSSGLMGPLKERVGGLFDEVTLFFGKIIGSEEDESCQTDLVSDFRDGNALADSLGIKGDERLNLILERCTSGKCVIYNTGIGDYFLKNGKLYDYTSRTGDAAQKFNEIPLSEKTKEEQEFLWELYNAVYSIEENDKSLEDYFSNFPSDQIILYGQHSEEGTFRLGVPPLLYYPRIYAVWQNDVWGVNLYDSKNLLNARPRNFSMSDEEILDLLSTNWYNINGYNVFYTLSSKHPYGINQKNWAASFEVWSDPYGSQNYNNWTGIKNITLRKDNFIKWGAKKKIEEWLLLKKEELRRKARIIENNFSILKSLVDSKVIEVDGQKFYLEAVNILGVNAVKISSDNNPDYYIYYSPVASINARFMVFEGSYNSHRIPLVGMGYLEDGELEKLDGFYYYFNQEEFDKKMKQLEIRNFLRGVC